MSESGLSRTRQALALAAFGAVTAVAPVAAQTLGRVDREWFDGLAKPRWNPPPWLFGPVWTLLYVAMAVAAWFAWRRGGWGGSHVLWLAQLAANALWTPLFFGAKRPGAALLDVVALDGLAAAAGVALSRRSGVAGALMLPYIAWTAFATALNGAIWRRNR